MKRTVRLMSTLLAVFLVIAALPLTAIAYTLSKTDVQWPDESILPVLKLDNLADATNNVEGSDVTFTPSTLQGSGKTNDTSDQKNENTVKLEDEKLSYATTTVDRFFWSIGATNLDLDANSQYVIEYKAKWHGEWKTSLGVVGFAFAIRDGASNEALKGGYSFNNNPGTVSNWDGLNICFDARTTDSNRKGLKVITEFAYNQTNAPRNGDIDQEKFATAIQDFKTYKIVFDKGVVSVFMDDALMGMFDISAHFAEGSGVQPMKLALGAFAKAAGGDTTVYAEVTDIVVQTGVPTTLQLLELDNLADATNNVEGSTVTFTPSTLQGSGQTNEKGDQTNKDAVKLEGNTLSYASTGTDRFYWSIGATNLDLNANSQYVIEYKAKWHGELNESDLQVVGFAFAIRDGASNSSLRGGYSYNKNAGTVSNWDGLNICFDVRTNTSYKGLKVLEEFACNGGLGSKMDIDHDKFATANQDFKTYKIVFDKGFVSVFMDDVLMGMIDISKFFAEGSNLQPMKLALGAFARNADGGTEVFAEVKDIVVQTGVPTTLQLLELDNLADEMNGAFQPSTLQGSGQTNEKGDQTNKDAVKLEGNTLSYASTGTDRFYWSIGATNLELSANSQYVIEYKAKWHGEWNASDLSVVGFAFAIRNGASNKALKGGYSYNNNAGTVSNWDGLNICFDVRGTNPGLKVIEEFAFNGGLGSRIDINQGKFAADIQDFKTYMIIFDKGVVSVFMDDALMGTIDISQCFAEGSKLQPMKLALGAFARNADGGTEVFAEVKDIVVHTGVPSVETKKCYDEIPSGTELLTMDTPFDANNPETWNSVISDIVVVPYKGTSNRYCTPVDGWDSDGVIDTLQTKVNEGSKGVLQSGMRTQLPLKRTTAYKIEIGVKPLVTMSDQMWIGVYWDVAANPLGDSEGKTQGVCLYKDKIVQGRGDTPGSLETKFNNLWENYTDQDGYTNIVILVEGTKAKVSIGGVEVECFNTPKYYGNQLGLTLRMADFGDNPSAEVLSVKDIKITKCEDIYAPGVTYKQGDRIIGESDLDWLDVTEHFPIENVEYDPATQYVVWFYEGTNVMVSTPYKSMGVPVTIEARVFNKEIVTVAGMQTTTIDENANTQSVRFISSLQSLQGSETGFEVVAKYMVNNELKTVSCAPTKTNKVYSTIAATENNTLKSISAEELGGIYICALAVNGVPTNIGRIDFCVRAYMVINGAKIYSTEVVFKLNNGVADQALTPLV